MTVHVVVCDCGLNGAWVEAVCSTQERAVEIAAEVNRLGRSRADAPGQMSYTGFGGAEVVPMEVDA